MRTIKVVLRIIYLLFLVISFQVTQTLSEKKIHLKYLLIKYFRIITITNYVRRICFREVLDKSNKSVSNDIKIETKL